MNDVKNGTTQLELIPVAARAASANGSAVDVRDYTGKVAVILMSAAGTGTSPTQDVKLQDSADGSTGWADISGAAFTQLTDAASGTEAIGVQIDEVARYIRPVFTIGGTTPSFAAGVVLVGRKKNN